MNEKQATTQERLSNGLEYGTDSSIEGEEKTNKDGGEAKISKKTYQKTLFFAVCLDVASLLINFIPVVGGFVSTFFIWIPGMTIMFIIYRKLGVPFHFKNSMKFFGCNIIEAIPILNALPGFTLSVVVNLKPLVEDDNDESSGVAGGNSVQSKIQQTLSKTVQK